MHNGESMLHNDEGMANSSDLLRNSKQQPFSGAGSFVC